MEIATGLRTEMEIFEEELQHLEDLHEDLVRPGDRFNPLGKNRSHSSNHYSNHFFHTIICFHCVDLQDTYMYLTKIVNGVAVAVEEVAKVGDVSL